jgi:hypothetical protein
MNASLRVAATCLALLPCLLSASRVGAQPESVTTKADLKGVIGFSNVTSQNGVVTGTVVNRGRYELRDVELLIRHVWVWDDDRHPGPVNPGTVSSLTVAGPIKVGGEAPFSFQLPSGDAVSTTPGHFTTAVEAMGYTEIVPPGS